MNIVDAPPPPLAWKSLELGAGELSAMTLALKYSAIALLDDHLARHTATAVGIPVWGTLRVIREAKHREYIPRIEPYVARLQEAGMWISQDIRQRILNLANE